LGLCGFLSVNATSFIEGKTATGVILPINSPSSDVYPLLIESKDCTYIAESKYNKETKRIEIRLTEKICGEKKSFISGYVFSNTNMLGLESNKIEVGLPVHIFEK
jgi:hypothetical protein